MPREASKDVVKSEDDTKLRFDKKSSYKETLSKIINSKFAAKEQDFKRILIQTVSGNLDDIDFDLDRARTSAPL